MIAVLDATPFRTPRRAWRSLSVILAGTLTLAGCSTLSGLFSRDDTPRPGPAQLKSDDFHVVARGDTVFALSRRYGVSAPAIRDANQLDDAYAIHVGQRLLIPNKGAVRSRSGAASVQAAKQPRRIAPMRDQPSAPLSRTTRQAAAFNAPDRLQRPVDGDVIRAFGEGEGARKNAGVDIAARPGAPVRAAADGKVAFVSDATSPVGQVVLLQHDGGMTTIYGRLAQVGVGVGQRVSAGAPIAVVAPRPHGPSALHFELRYGSDPVNPTPFL